MRSKSFPTLKPIVKIHFEKIPSIKQLESQIKIDNGAVELIQVALTEFICFITSDIIEDVRDQQRVAIKDQDILESMKKLGFDNYIPTLDALMKRLNLN